MVAGKGTADQADARLWAYRDRAGFARLIDILVEASVDYLSLQAEAGADVLQVFDTWAGSLPPSEFEAWVVAPTARVVNAVRAKYPGVPIIGFARGVGEKIGRYAAATGVQGVGCDTGMRPQAMADLARSAGVVVQGNLDPLVLVAGGVEMERQVGELLKGLAGVPHIFNLGHGIVPQTPPEHVARLVELVRGRRLDG
jgi:uroporphyrinogen decarboxylase